MKNSDSEQKQTLKRSDAFLQKLIQSAVDGVIAADMKGNIIIFNDSASEISGYTGREVFTEINIRDVYPGDGAREVMQKLRSEDYGGVGKLKSRKIDVKRKDGEIIPILLNAAIIYEDQQEVATIGFFHDLREELRIRDELEKTQVQLLQAEIRASQSRERAIIDAFPSGALVVDEKGQVVLMNPAFKKHLELNPDTPAGKPIEEYVDNRNFCRFVRSIPEQAAIDPDEAPTCEFGRSQDKYFLAKARPVSGEQEENLGAVVILVDITAIKLLDRLKSEFVAKVSHELKSPLSTIHEQLSIVLEELTAEQQSDNQQILFRARERTNSLISMISDLLDISRIETGLISGEGHTPNLARVLTETVDFYQSKARDKGHTMTLDLPEKAFPPVKADPIALQSIFSNLITNAINYTPQEGRIEVRAGFAGEFICVAIADNGLGIAPEYMDKIFERFYRVQTEKTRMIPGTGLGLAIAKEMLTSIGGHVEVSSEPDKGSVFTVYLPIEEAAAETSGDA
ncbi:MAG: ATP-binding protein [Desulfobacterales bacterium]|nr:ATP-binding protein [Desulfobacterales bacterium]